VQFALARRRATKGGSIEAVEYEGGWHSGAVIYTSTRKKKRPLRKGALTARNEGGGGEVDSVMANCRHIKKGVLLAAS